MSLKLGDSSTNGKRGDDDEAALLLTVTTTTTANNKEAKKTMTPFEEYFDRFKTFRKAHNFIGSVMIKGIESNGDSSDNDSEEEEEEEDKSKYTTEQMASLCYVMINQS